MQIFLWHASSPLSLPFLWPYQAKQIVFHVVHIEPTVYDLTVQIWQGILAFLEPNCGPIYVFTKKTSISTLCFRAKSADELVKELWPVNLHRKSSVWPCWLRIAQFFGSDLWCMSDLCLLNPVKFRAWVYQLKQLIASIAPGDQIYLKLRLLCHCWSKTSLESGGCTKATNKIYKSATISISFFEKEVLRVSMSRCGSRRNAWA